MNNRIDKYRHLRNQIKKGQLQNSRSDKLIRNIAFFTSAFNKIDYNFFNKNKLNIDSNFNTKQIFSFNHIFESDAYESLFLDIDNLKQNTKLLNYTNKNLQIQNKNLFLYRNQSINKVYDIYNIKANQQKYNNLINDWKKAVVNYYDQKQSWELNHIIINDSLNFDLANFQVNNINYTKKNLDHQEVLLDSHRILLAKIKKFKSKGFWLFNLIGFLLIITAVCFGLSLLFQ